MAKPTEDLSWANNATVNDILESTSGQRASGIALGGSWTRRRLNWMFHNLGKMHTWIKDNVRSNDENDTRYVQHSEVVDSLTSTSATTPLSANKGKELNDKFGTSGGQVQTNTQNQTQFLSKSGNLVGIGDKTEARKSLGMYEGSVTSGGSYVLLPDTGWLVSRTAQGRYTITHNKNTTDYVVILSVTNNVDLNNEYTINLLSKSLNSFTLDIQRAGGGSSDNPFDFTVTFK